jgi:tetratricopeptide (TPR) repeat protein
VSVASSSSRVRWTSIAGAVALTGLLALYVWVVATRATALIRTGEPVGIGLGIAFWILPPLVIWLVAREWRLAVDVQRMADELAAADELPVDDLPRSPGGRIDRAAARAAFEPARELAEAEPDDWRSWYHLAFAYDAAGDRRRARESLRKASALHKA